MDMPIGLRLTRTARTVATAFERAMAEAGGSASAGSTLPGAGLRGLFAGRDAFPRPFASFG